MPFTGFLIDRARRVFDEQEPTEWNEDGPEFAEKHGPWFRVRLTVREPRETAPSGRGAYVYLEGDAELLVGTRDLEGGYLVDLSGRFTGFGVDDRLEVVTKRSEDGEVWEINTGPEPIRKVRGRLLGFKVGLRRQQEPSVEPGA